MTVTEPVEPRGGAAPTADDVPAELVTSTYSADLWQPVRSSACGEAAAGRPLLFFSCGAGEGPLVAAAAARPLAADPATPQAALRELLAGPTADEERAGFVSNFGAETAGFHVSVEVHRAREHAVVDLDRRLLDVDFAFVSVQEVAQIVSTVGQFPEIRWVSILVGGEPLCDVLEVC